jgi:ketosteroid isomerase-like protein
MAVSESDVGVSTNAAVLQFRNPDSDASPPTMRAAPAICANIMEGDTVATHLRTFFTKQANGRVVQVDMAVFFTFRDGCVAQIREIIDSYDLVQEVLEREIGPLITGETSEEA